MTNYICFDLEMNQPSGKLIQIGAVVCNLQDGIIAEFERYIKIDEPLRQDIIELTGITEADLEDKGVKLKAAYRELKELAEKHKCSKMPITWGCGDKDELRDALIASGMNFSYGFGDDKYEQFIFGRRYFDAKTLFQCYKMSKGEKIQAGLAKALTKLNMKFEGRKHTALDDAKNTFYIFQELLKKFNG